MAEPSTALALALVAAQVQAPAFDVLPLGVKGGTYEDDLSCFAVRPHGAARYRVLLDAGTVATGIARHLGTRDPAEVERFLFGFEDVLLTHAHLDHLAGLIMVSPALLGREGPALRVRGHPRTVATVRDHMLRSDLWADFEEMGALELVDAPTGQAFQAGGLRITPLKLDHTVPAHGYLLEVPGGAAMVHLGDTGPTRAEFEVARPRLRRGKLRALSLECSFPDEAEELAILTGHLTPRLIARHLYELTSGREPPARDLTDREVAATGAALRGVRVLLHHVKPEGAAVIRQQVAALRARGLPMDFLHQGRVLSF